MQHTREGHVEQVLRHQGRVHWVQRQVDGQVNGQHYTASSSKLGGVLLDSLLDMPLVGGCLAHTAGALHNCTGASLVRLTASRCCLDTCALGGCCCSAYLLVSDSDASAGRRLLSGLPPA